MMASRTKWTEKLQAQGRDPRIVDVLETLGKEKKRNREDEHVAGGTADSPLCTLRKDADLGRTSIRG